MPTLLAAHQSSDIASHILHTTDEKGHGPAWANSLFEDNAEFGFGIIVAITQRRDKIKEVCTRLISKQDCPEVEKKVIQNWLDHAHEIEGSEIAGNELKKFIAEC